MTTPTYQLIVTMSSLNDLQTAVLRTVIYYDTFDYPLTAAEIRRWLYPRPGVQLPTVSVEEVAQALNQLQQQGRLEQADDFWYLPGRSSIVELRAKRLVENKR